MFKNFFKYYKNDIPASVVVFLVAVPLCLGISLASGAPLMGGIIAGIVGGIVVTAFSKSSLGVSGPAAGLAIIVFSSIEELGSYEAFLLAGMIAGVLQLVLGFVKAGIVAYYFPSSVIKGMLAAIGIIIFFKQIPHAVGYDKDFEGNLSFFQADGENTFSELINMIGYITPSAVVVSIVGIAILLFWETSLIKRNKILSQIPAPLLVVISGILLSILFMNINFYPLTQDHLVTIPVMNSIEELKSIIVFPDFKQIGNPLIWQTAGVLAIVASIETLLSVEATDKLDHRKRITPTNRELKAQGLGNITSSLIGGLPITQVIVRSSVNIQTGGISRTSAFLHGVWLLLCVLFIPQVLNLIPLASLAAVLFVVGFKLAKPSLFKVMKTSGKEQFIPFVVTVIAIVFTDLLTGVIIGMIVAIFFILYNNYKKPFYIDLKSNENGVYEVHIKLAEDVTFLNKARILHTLKSLPEGTKVVIDAHETANIHGDVLEIIQEYSKSGNAYEVELKGFHDTKERDPHKMNMKAIKNQSQYEKI